MNERTGVQGGVQGGAGGGVGGGLSERWHALPRAARWLVWLVGLLVVYFAGIEPALDAAARLRAKADAAQRTLSQQASIAQSASTAGALMARGTTALGVPDEPPLASSTADPLVALNSRIDRSAREHGVSIRRRTQRPREAMTGAVFGGEALERVGVEIVVECDTRQLMAMVRDLEAAPEVHALRSVRVQRQSLTPGGGGVLQATLVPETFVPKLRAAGGA